MGACSVKKTTKKQGRGPGGGGASSNRRRSTPGRKKSFERRREPRTTALPPADTHFEFGGHSFEFRRHPEISDPTLRAWSAADEYVLRTLFPDSEASSASSASSAATTGAAWKSILVANDPFGALTVVLHALLPDVKVVHLTDSWLGQESLRKNLVANGYREDAVASVNVTSDPEELDTRFDLVVIHVPKALAFLGYEAEWMKPCLAPAAKVLAVGMTKHLSPHTSALLEERFGPTQTLRVFKKAVIFQVDEITEQEVDEEALMPAWYEIATEDDDSILGEDTTRAAGEPTPGGRNVDELDADEPRADGAIRVFAYPGVFGARRLDAGTRLLLQHLPALEPGQHAVDLGCGSGVLGLALATSQPEAKITLVDESYLAIASAALSFEENGLPAPETLIADGVGGLPSASMDLVVSNPPFHSNHAMTVEEATRLFRPAFEVLKPGGMLLVVGAHGVDYGPTLRRIFGGSTRLGSDRRYSVLGASKSAAQDESPRSE